MDVASRKTVIVLISALILDLLAFTCILPLFPSIIDFYAVESRKDSLYTLFDSTVRSVQNLALIPNLTRYNNVLFGGLLGSLFSALQFVSSPILGALSDVYGRKSILLISVLGTLTSYIIWSQSDTFTLFIVSRIIGGLSKASVSVSITIMADIFPAAKRGIGTALVGIAFSIGFIVGPMFGAYFSSIAPSKQGIDELFTLPAYFAISLTVVQLFLLVVLLPETLTTPKIALKDILRNVLVYLNPWSLFSFSALEESQSKEALRAIRAYGLVYFLYLFLFSGLEFTLSFFTHLRFGYDSMQQGRMYLFTGFIMILIQGNSNYRVKKESAFFREMGIVAIVLSYLVISISQVQSVFYFGLSLYAVASATVVPCITSCVLELANESDKGVTTGIFRSLGALARALGPMVASTLFWVVGPAFCYAVGGLSLAIPLVLLRRVRYEENAEKIK
ncbi:hypothetical protein QR680_002110 [Steinernema hermaphroditum]|uniref:Major facilitator superfamily (MFS) profile domain-containing protein n=1 Tax=Steinernema hermaphroditum TaxID=289476 RepID=A0AA39H428_9BILA|nr:hypothetical protein QR680_002110 [Steinernema hermaphroditum]